MLMVDFYISVVRELAELHKANASRASEVEEAALSRETQAKEQLSLALEKAQEEARMQQEALANQVTRAHAVDTQMEQFVCYACQSNPAHLAYINVKCTRQRALMRPQ